MLAETSFLLATGPLLVATFLAAVSGCLAFGFAYYLTRAYRMRRKEKQSAHHRCIRRLEALEKPSAAIHAKHLELMKARVKLEWRRHEANQLVESVSVHFFMALGQAFLLGVFFASYIAFSVLFREKLGGLSTFFIMFIMPLSQIGLAFYAALAGPSKLQETDITIALVDSQLVSIGIAVPPREELTQSEPASTATNIKAAAI